MPAYISRRDGGEHVDRDQDQQREERGEARVSARCRVVSSFADRQVSQPQYMKIDSDSAVASTENDSTENGLSHDNSKSVAVETSPFVALVRASTMKSTRATIWIASRTYVTPFVVVIPR